MVVASQSTAAACSLLTVVFLLDFFLAIFFCTGKLQEFRLRSELQLRSAMNMTTAATARLLDGVNRRECATVSLRLPEPSSFHAAGAAAVASTMDDASKGALVHA